MEPVFFDCEASALEGIPIEIGWASLNPVTGAIASEGHLIRPAPEWRIDDLWDPDAQKLHGITRFDLHREGRPVRDVAHRMNVALAGRELFADDTRDEAWLRRIFDAAGLDPLFRIRQTSARAQIARKAAERGVSAEAMERIKAEASEIAPHQHRAEADALHLAIQWKLVTLQG